MMKHEFVNKMKQKGYNVFFSSKGKMDDMVIEKENDTTVFSQRIDPILRHLQFPDNALKWMEKETLKEIICYFEQLPGTLFIHFKDKDRKKVLHFLQELSYEEIDMEKYVDVYTFRFKKSIYTMNKKNEKEFIEQLKMFKVVEETLKKYEKNETLIEMNKLTMNRYRVYINGAYVVIEFKRNHDKVDMVIKGEEGGISLEKKLTNEKDIKEFLSDWVEDVLKKQRLRALTQSYTHFFNQWMRENKFYFFKQEIYEGLSAYFSPLEIEKIAATYIKNMESYKKMNDNEHLIYFEKKVIFLNTAFFDILVFDKDETFETKLIEYLTKKEKEKIEKKVKSVLI